MEYSLKFSERLIEAAKCLAKQTPLKEDADRAILYLSLVSCEISIKALLEKAGYSVKHLKKRAHSFSKLKRDLGFCDFQGKHSTGARLFSKSPDPKFKIMTVGKLLDFEETTASKYPNEIRYGDVIEHYPPDLMLKCAIEVNKWANKHIPIIKRKK